MVYLNIIVSLLYFSPVTVFLLFKLRRLKPFVGYKTVDRELLVIYLGFFHATVNNIKIKSPF